MAHKAKGMVKLNSKYNFRYSTNAVAEMEERLGIGIPKFFDGLKDGSLGFNAIRVFVWAGLIHQFENEDGTYDITLKDVGEIIDEEGLKECMNKAKQAFNIAFPTEDEPQANREQRRQGKN